MQHGTLAFPEAVHDACAGKVPVPVPALDDPLILPLQGTRPVAGILKRPHDPGFAVYPVSHSGQGLPVEEVQSPFNGICKTIGRSIFPVVVFVFIQVTEGQEQGIPVYGWTVDEGERILELLEMGIDGIITNDPVRAAKISKRYQKLNPAQRVLLTYRRFWNVFYKMGLWKAVDAAAENSF